MLNDKTVELVNRIRDHAHIHYEEDGWDILAECWSVNDILDCIGDANTFEEAIIRISDTLSVINGYREEIQAETF